MLDGMLCIAVPRSGWSPMRKLTKVAQARERLSQIASASRWSADWFNWGEKKYLSTDSNDYWEPWAEKAIKFRLHIGEFSFRGDKITTPQLVTMLDQQARLAPWKRQHPLAMKLITSYRLRNNHYHCTPDHALLLVDVNLRSILLPACSLNLGLS